MKRTMLFSAALLMIFLILQGMLTVAVAQIPRIQMLDKTSTIVDMDAEMQQLASEFRFTEGPAPDEAGNVYFSDIPNNQIFLWSLEDELTVFMENSGGANGLYIDDDGYIIACQGNARRLVSISPTGEVSVIVDEYNGKKFNSPNDLWVAPNGGIYFTDPRYGNRDNMEMGEHVYYVSPDRENIIRVIDDLTRPNGVIGTPNGEVLYVADQGAKETYQYLIEDDGTLTQKTKFIESGSDGMTLDEQGNVYLTSGAVKVYNSIGTQIATINVPESPANVCFGGENHDELYITARTSLYMIPMKTHGVQMR